MSIYNFEKLAGNTAAENIPFAINILFAVL